METYTHTNAIDFIGIGAPKSGSTWLAMCLEKHPDVLLPPYLSYPHKREINFFNDKFGDYFIAENDTNYSNYKKGIDWYLAQFPPAENGKIRGEFSTSYIYDSESSNRIRRHFPDAKIIATLRNPVDMVHSVYWWFQASSWTRINFSFDEVVKREMLLEYGLFYENLKRYYDIFPIENIHAVLLDDIISDPERITKQIYMYLNIRDDFKPHDLDDGINPAIQVRFPWLRNLATMTTKSLDNMKLHSLNSFIGDNLYHVYKKINHVHRPYEPMSSTANNTLLEFFKPDIADLEKLIGRDLSMWIE
ncbi:MAG: sulfotransferase [bacterium]|nr:sulfotransferase [bacterium]